MRLLAVAAACAALTACVADAPAGPDDDDAPAEPDALAAAARAAITADVDEGGGVYLANRPGGYYMGRLLVGWHFDRQGAWYLSAENHSDYAWAMAYGHSNACLWVGPSRGRSGFTAGTWASASTPTASPRCDDAHRTWLADTTHLASHMNCPEPSSATNGTEKPLLVDATFYWNVRWTGGAMGYDGGALADPVKVIKAGTHVWYRYTTRDGKALVAFVPGVGWGFFAVGVLDRTHTGTWSTPTDPATLHPC